VRKLNSVEHEEIVRRANAAKAKVLACNKNPDSVTARAIELQVEELRTKEDLVDALAPDELAKRINSVEAEVASQEKWSKDDYLQGLQDSWQEGLYRTYHEDPDNEEAKHVYEEIQAYVKEVQDSLGEVEDDIKNDLRGNTEPKLREKLYESRLLFEG